MNGAIVSFVAALAWLAASAMAAPPAASGSGAQPSGAKAASPAPRLAPSPPVHATPSYPPSVGGMKSNSSSPPMMVIRRSAPPPPIVAIPRIPGPADMMVATGSEHGLRTIRSFPSNEACDAALAIVRRTFSNAFCVSTTPPPPPPKLGFLAEIEGGKELVGLTTYPSMAACAAALTALPPLPARRRMCIDRIH
jgi:hypothetical protein